jgi:hypothetical protein
VIDRFIAESKNLVLRTKTQVFLTAREQDIAESGKPSFWLLLNMRGEFSALSDRFLLQYNRRLLLGWWHTVAFGEPFLVAIGVTTGAGLL